MRFSFSSPVSCYPLPTLFGPEQMSRSNEGIMRCLNTNWNGPGTTWVVGKFLGMEAASLDRWILVCSFKKGFVHFFFWNNDRLIGSCKKYPRIPCALHPSFPHVDILQYNIKTRKLTLVYYWEETTDQIVQFHLHYFPRGFVCICVVLCTLILCVWLCNYLHN